MERILIKVCLGVLLLMLITIGLTPIFILTIMLTNAQYELLYILLAFIPIEPVIGIAIADTIKQFKGVKK